MSKKNLVIIFIAAIIFVGLYVAGLYKKNPAENYPLAGYPSVNPAIRINACVSKDCWFEDGPIYETHPYYYDGTFSGLTAKIPEIADLGVKTIYLMPIWEHRSKDPQYLHVYLINDYYKINSQYGTAADLKKLIDTVHSHNMKIIFDMVTAALPKENIAYKWTLRIPLADLEKKAKELGLTLKYTKDDNGNRIIYSGWYPAYILNSEVAGIVEGQEVALMAYPSPIYGPAIDRSNPDAIEYFTNVAAYYIKEYDIDGWRLDSTYDAWNPKIISGDHSIVGMVKSMRMAIQKIKPNAILLAEQASYKLDEVADISYEPKELRESVMDGTAKGKLTSQELVGMINSQQIGYGRTRAFFSETHDLRRIRESYSKQDKLLLVLNSTIPGVPMIQAGQEIGTKKHWFYPLPSDPKINWNGGDYELRDYYKKVFGIRNSSNAFKYGDIKNVWKSGDSIYTYSRTYENETVVVAINMNSRQSESILSMPFPKNTKLMDELSGETFMINDPVNFKISISAYGARILSVK
jgi:alpha-amylase